MGLRYRAGAMGMPFMPLALDDRLGRRQARRRPAQDHDLPVHRRAAGAAAGAQPRRGADPRAALRRLRQRPARRPAVHGHRHRHGGQPRDPDDRAHRLQRPDPPHARPDAHPVLHRRGGGRGADAAARRTSATALYEPFFGHLDDYAELHRQGPACRGAQQYLDEYYYGPKSWSDYLAKLGMDAVLDACRRGRSVYND